MSTSSTHEVTKLLLAWRQGDETALDRLIPLVYRELHHLAKRYMRRERGGHTLQTTALVNEAYLHLVDYARGRRSDKRGGQELHVALDEAAEVPQARSVDLIALDDALQSLARIDLRKSRVVEMRFFAGLTLEEIAEVFKVSSRTVSRDWELAQAWLYREMSNR